MSSLLGSRGIIENGMGTEKLMEIFFFFQSLSKKSHGLAYCQRDAGLFLN